MSYSTKEVDSTEDLALIWFEHDHLVHYIAPHWAVLFYTVVLGAVDHYLVRFLKINRTRCDNTCTGYFDYICVIFIQITKRSYAYVSVYS